MKTFARVIALALPLVFVAATSAEAQRGPRGDGPRGGGPRAEGPRGGGPRGGGSVRPGFPGRNGGIHAGGPRGPRHGGGFGRGQHRPQRPVIYPVPYPYPTGRGYCGVFDDCYGNYGGYGSTTYYSEVACAPGVVEGNVKATERTLTQLASSPDFKGASTFKKEIARISSMKSNSEKTAQYFAMIGINPEDSETIVAFMGARDAKGQWLNDLEKNAGLTPVQAEKVAVSLQSTLRGGLQ